MVQSEPRLLCLDAGNTRIKFALHDGVGWCFREALPTRFALTDPDVFARALIDRLPERPTRIAACSVAGPTVAAAFEQIALRLDCPLEWLRSSESALGVRNGYAVPTQLGHDRWAALIAARAICAGPCIVVMAGTATTIDALDAAGVFRGGVILPGLNLMRRSLADATAQLPHTERTALPSLWPDNTAAAISQGSVLATVGAIALVRKQLAAELTDELNAERTNRINTLAVSAVSCVLSGGAAESVLPWLDEPVVWRESLVLDGVQRWAADAAQCTQ
jgi:type III pantothenate kinase